MFAKVLKRLISIYYAIITDHSVVDNPTCGENGGFFCQFARFIGFSRHRQSAAEMGAPSKEWPHRTRSIRLPDTAALSLIHI